MKKPALKKTTHHTHHKPAKPLTGNHPKPLTGNHGQPLTGKSHSKSTHHHTSKPQRAKGSRGVPHAYGYTPDDPDERDWELPDPGAVEFAFVDLSKDPAMPPVWDQGELGSCTAHGSLAAFLWAATKDGSADPMLSRLQVYYNARALEGTTSEDAGAQIRDAIKACAEGVAPEIDWPYDVSRFAVKPSALAVADAAANKAVNYWSVGRWPRAIQSCLSQAFPVVIGVTLYESFESQGAIDSGVVPYPKPGENVLGGHCMAVVGIGYGHEWVADGQFPAALPDTHYVKVRNSWGTDVYQGGYLLLPVSYLHRFGQDFWTIRLAT